MPRSVPARGLNEVLAWTTLGSRPWASNSSRLNVRANQPRSSERRSNSITHAPSTGVRSNLIGASRWSWEAIPRTSILTHPGRLPQDGFSRATHASEIIQLNSAGRGASGPVSGLGIADVLPRRACCLGQGRLVYGRTGVCTGLRRRYRLRTQDHALSG